METLTVLWFIVGWKKRMERLFQDNVAFILLPWENEILRVKNQQDNYKLKAGHAFIQQI